MMMRCDTLRMFLRRDSSVLRTLFVLTGQASPPPLPIYLAVQEIVSQSVSQRETRHHASYTGKIILQVLVLYPNKNKKFKL